MFFPQPKFFVIISTVCPHRESQWDNAIFEGVAYLKVSWNTLLILILRPKIIDVYNRRININKILTPYFFSTNSTNWSVVKSPPNSFVISVSKSLIKFITSSELSHWFQSTFRIFLRDFCFSATYRGQNIKILTVSIVLSSMIFVDTYFSYGHTTIITFTYLQNLNKVTYWQK